MNEGIIPAAEPDPYADLSAALREEFSAIHPAATVTRCVDAARYGALEITGHAHPWLVERIARKHLQVLALAASGRDR
ncbi:hypothetical protein HS048_03865 [Planomonospora sp. ID91781]|uniref:TetR family transcriptional regulator n=3 Tax=Planomonospora TaxID=1998 RepID=A0A171DK41_9ACTN|nr:MULTISPECIES: hypothetical protein [Planomonospora]MBG0819882.1 hypothetical protein [Planomonospora sp. ID91781]GAT69189.1 hypothetical protein PS9374_04860 [Planomonospora sphaerica]GGK60168.1 hypothetical protein GCM10010126_19640 [Planomonospora parontospora]GII08806.1 hypothetical protein Ppa06_26040 [Planomonospora parontospora subsp. parontospora]